MYVYILWLCLVFTEAKRGHLNPWDWSYRQLWVLEWVLGIEPGSSRKATSALNQWIISPAPLLGFGFCCNLHVFFFFFRERKFFPGQRVGEGNKVHASAPLYLFLLIFPFSVRFCLAKSSWFSVTSHNGWS